MPEPQKTSLIRSYYACVCFPYSWTEVSTLPLCYYSDSYHSIFSVQVSYLHNCNHFSGQERLYPLDYSINSVIALIAAVKICILYLGLHDVIWITAPVI
jgi:hypothetical protein